MMNHSGSSICLPFIVKMFLISFSFCLTLSINRNWNNQIFMNHLKNSRWWHLYKMKNDPNIATNSLQYAFTKHQWHQFYSFDPIRRKLYSQEQRHNWRNFTDLPANSDLIQVAIEGIRKGIYTCKKLFINHRWNCPTPNYNNPSALLFGDIMLKGFPETAFIYAMLSASVVQTVAEACSFRLSHCPCNNKGRISQSNWIWQGCDDNVQFGRRFARKMFDPEHADWHKKSLMNLHNTGAGRREAVKSMKVKCVCQGTSGSCTTKICHRKVSSISEIGNSLKIKYETAVKVVRNNDIHSLLDSQKNKASNKNLKYRTGLVVAKKHIFIPTEKKYPDTSDIVYLEDVPKNFYCDSKPEWHILGTTGRICNSLSNSTDSCDNLCCNRPFLTRSKTIMEQCHCKFIWCCVVECQQCQKRIFIETCQ
uniref:Protein Wnt n=2 Tax=Dugesia japonica TaxID=6161 RepID=F5C3T8_DUGJA|nr:wnt-1 [Dugesia japonica]